MSSRKSIIGLAFLLSLTSQPVASDDSPPRTREDLKWLEDMSSQRVLDWAKERDIEGRAFAGLYPERDEIVNRIEEASRYLRFSPPVERGGRYFYTSFDPDLTQVSLHLRESIDVREQTLIDGEQLLQKEGLSLHRVVWPSPDGKRVAYGVRQPASRWMTIRIRDLATSRDLQDRLVGLVGGLSTLSWARDGAGFYYERFKLPAESELLTARLRDEEVRFHRVGDPQTEDTLVYRLEDPENQTLALSRSDDYRFLVLSVRDGRQSGNRLDLIDLEGDGQKIVTLADSADSIYRFVGSSGSEIWAWTHEGAPKARVVAIDLDDQTRRWRTLIPEGKGAIDTWIGARSVGDSIAVGYQEHDRRVVRIFGRNGRARFDLEPPNLGSIWTGLVPDAAGRYAFYSLSGFADPGTVFRLDMKTGTSEVFRRPRLPFDPNKVTTRLVHYEGPAGPRIPMYLAHHRDVQIDGSQPVMIYGYGFGGWSSGPWFRAHLWEFFRRGGVFALPALRGGGERGEDWHQAGSGRRRQNAVDDYIAASEWLIREGLARPERLIAETQSAGASLVGAALLQRPDLFGAGILAFPLLDLLSYENYTGGARWRSELGTVENAGDRQAMLAYSPVHNVDPGRCYPPVLLLPGAKDEITPPMHAYKLVAALEEVQKCDQKVLLRVAWNAGHAYGGNAQESVASFADQLSFALRTIDERSHMERALTAPSPRLGEVEIIGIGPTPLLVIPCASCRWRSFEEFAERNRERFTTVAVTLPGYGGTASPQLPIFDSKPHWQPHVLDALERLLDEQDLRDVIAVGHSFGARIALQLAARRPDRIRGLVNLDGSLVGPLARESQSPQERLAAAQTIRQQFMEPLSDPDAWQQFNLPSIDREDRRILYHGWFMASNRTAMTQYWWENLLESRNPLLRALSMPVLDVQTFGPKVTDVEAAQRRYRKRVEAQGLDENYQLLFYDNVGHFLMEDRPELLDALVIAFAEGSGDYPAN